MADKKYQVFISSTYSDLKEERRKILDILLMADCIPSGMEAFVATDNEQFEVIKKVIDLCDYYVLIIGKRYGSVSLLTGKSYTEMEYDYAKSKNIPVLVFAIDDSVELPECKIESDQSKKELLKQFREKAMSNRLVSIWKSVDELTGALAISIMRAQKEVVRPGWQRGTDYDEASLRREISTLRIDKDRLLYELSDAHATIASFTEQTDLAFENYKILLKYNWSRLDGYMISHSFNGEVEVDLKDLFVTIALEMLEVPLQEYDISAIIKSKFIGTKESYSFDDPQIVKLLLVQFSGLGLIKRQLVNNTTEIMWELTDKGKKIRDESTLIHNVVK